MIKNYFKIAWRNLIKNKVHSLINVVGLAVGMTVAMIIGLWIKHELSHDRQNSNYHNIAQVLQKQTHDGVESVQYSIPFPLGSELLANHGDNFKHVVMSDWFNDHILKYKDNTIRRSGTYMDVDGPRLMDLKITNGTLDGLVDQNSIMLSESVAKLFFGEEDPIGKIVLLDNKLQVSVTGVFQDIPSTSGFKDIKFLAPWDLYTASFPWVTSAKNNPTWDNNSYQLFVQISDQVDLKVAEERIKKVKYDHLSESQKWLNSEIILHPMSDWHLKSNWENGIKKGGLIQYVWLFGFIGLFVLLLACINFVNLNTAQSINRSKEVGVRKTMGGSRKQIIFQFLSESLLTCLISYILSLMMLIAVNPFFSTIFSLSVSIPYANFWFWSISSLFVLITALLAGIYPALFISSFRPVKTLSGTFSVGSSTSTFRQSLVVFQFTISILLLIGTLAVKKQIDHIQERPLGFEKDGVIVVAMTTEDYIGKYHLLRNELIKNEGIIDLTYSSSPLSTINNGNGGFSWPGKDPNMKADFATIWVTHDYGNTVGWNVKQGRDFSREFKTDSVAYIVNEAAIKYMGLEDPIGKSMTWGRSKPHEIIGVVEDMTMESPFEAVNPAIYMMDYKVNANYIMLKLNPSLSISSSISKIEEVFTKLVPAIPLTYTFVDEEHQLKFATESQIAKLSAIFTFLAIFINGLGLIGLASFVAQQRKKEIGIRKVIGASVFQLWSLLTKDYLKLVGISCIVAVPLGYLLLSKWLQNYEFQTKLSWWIFAFACIASICLSILIVSFQSIKAAITNPINSLRTE